MISNTWYLITECRYQETGMLSSQVVSSSHMDVSGCVCIGKVLCMGAEDIPDSRMGIFTS